MQKPSKLRVEEVCAQLTKPTFSLNWIFMFMLMSIFLMFATLSATLSTSMMATMAIVHLHVGHHNIVSSLCEGLETLTEWKSESITGLPTYGRTGVGARNACASKQREVEKTWHRAVILMAGCVHLVGYERATGYYMRSPCGRRCSCIPDKWRGFSGLGDAMVSWYYI